MPIRPPRLDDRRYADLVEELLARIPAHAPEYTDPRPGDPGRTLIELFAWLADTLLYRVNYIPDRQRLEFLRMVGLPLRPAQPARGLAALRYKGLDGRNAPTVSVTMRHGARIKAPVEFETLRPVTVHPVVGQAFYKRTLSARETEKHAGLLTDLAELYRVPRGTVARGYVTTPAFPGEVAVPGGVDLATAAVDGSLWIGLFAGRPEDEMRDAAKAALGRSSEGLRQVLSVGVAPAMEPGDAFDEDLTGGAGTARPIPVAWEITTGRMNARGAEVVELEVLRDSTSGLTRTGVVDLVLPDVAFIGAPTNDVRRDVDAGVGARPPRLDDPKLAARLITWIRLRPTTPVDRLALSWVGVHAVEVDQRRTYVDLGVGTSDGTADQRLQLPVGAVERATFRLQVEEEGRGWVDWQMVEHMALAGRDERVGALDDEAGLVVFGDGVRGAIPDAGRRVRATLMRAGGGPAGNLPVGNFKSVEGRKATDGAALPHPIEISQPIPTEGGAAAESLEEAEKRLPEVLRHRERAITADDYIAVAGATPGMPLGRVEVLPGFKPHQTRSGVPGVVSVMVLPRNDGLLPPNPRPSRHTIEAVYDHLSAAVPLGTELYVIGCQYVPVGVGVAFELRAGHGREDTLSAVRLAIRNFLWPLSPGGPFGEAAGWPLKRAVRARELEVAVARVPGVDEVIGVRLFAREGEDDWKPAPEAADGTQQIDLLDYQLPELLGLVVVADGEVPTSLEVGPSRGAPEIAIPVIPEKC